MKKPGAEGNRLGTRHEPFGVFLEPNFSIFELKLFKILACVIPCEGNCHKSFSLLVLPSILVLL